MPLGLSFGLWKEGIYGRVFHIHNRQIPKLLEISFSFESSDFSR